MSFWENSQIIQETRDHLYRKFNVYRYNPTSEELDFYYSSRRKVLFSRFLGTFVGVTIPFHFWNRKIYGINNFDYRYFRRTPGVIPFFLLTILSGYVGGNIGASFAMAGVMKKGILLQNSPIAKEARLYIISRNPQHPMIQYYNSKYPYEIIEENDFMENDFMEKDFIEKDKHKPYDYGESYIDDEDPYFPKK